jgi:hypothetical protein
MSDVPQNEIKSIGNLLARTAEIAEQASITGIFEDGARRCVQQYNASVVHLESLSAIPKGFFLPLPDTAGFGEAGVACAQLAAYLGVASIESKGGSNGPKYTVMNAPQGGLSREEQQELKDIREILRTLTSKKDEGSSA